MKFYICKREKKFVYVDMEKDNFKFEKLAEDPFINAIFNDVNRNRVNEFLSSRITIRPDSRYTIKDFDSLIRKTEGRSFDDDIYLEFID